MGEYTAADTAGLKQEPDFVLAADVVYGSNLEVWDALVREQHFDGGRKCAQPQV